MDYWRFRQSKKPKLKFNKIREKKNITCQLSTLTSNSKDDILKM